MKNNTKGYDIIIPVYNENNIIRLIEYLENSAKNISTIYICYDYEEDTSLHAIKKSKYSNSKKILLVKNFSKGPCEAIKSGIYYSKAQSIVVYPADDFNNGLLLDKMFGLYLDGYDVICPSRFMQGGLIKNCPFLKLFIVRIVSFTLFYFSKIKTKDPTNGFRMFSRRLLNNVPIESKEGFAYSIELLIKAQKQNFKVIEIPSIWIERKDRKSSFKLIRWSIAYIKWYFSAFFI